MKFVFFLLLIGTLLPVCAPAQTAGELYSKGRKMEKKGRVVDAYLLYSQAAVLDPTNPRYRAYAQAVQSQAILQGKPNLVTSAPVEDASADDESVGGRVSEADLLEARKPQPPRELTAAAGTRSFELKDNAKALFEKVSAAFHLDVVFDGDYQATHPIRFHVENVDYRTALHSLEAATGSFLIPISERVLLVAKDTPQKRQELEPTAAVVVDVPNTVTVQEAQELTRNLQQTFDIQKMVLDSARRIILIRDRVSKVYPAETFLRQMIVYSGQVRIEVEFLAVNDTTTTNYGITLPSVFNLLAMTNPAANLTSGLARILGGKTFLGVTIGDSSLIANVTKSTAHTLLRTDVLSLDGKPATIHVGDKYPIITAGYYGTGSDTGGNQYTPPPTFNFEDLGVVMKLTPYIHGDHEVTIEIEAENKALAGAVTNGIPVISNRKFQTKVRLKDDQWAIVSGLVNGSLSLSVSGPAGLSSLPFLGLPLRQNTRQTSSGQVLMIIKPTLVGLPPGDGEHRPVWVGTETRPLSQL